MENTFYSKYIKYKTKYIKLKNNLVKVGGGSNNKNIYNPIFIKSYDIYDVLYNDRNQIIIISPAENNPLEIKYIGTNSINTSSDSSNLSNSSDLEYYKKFNLEICPHNHTFIYYCSVYLYEPEIFLEINGKKIKTKVNKYPEFIDEIIMSTIVKNEDNYIIQWIEYHRKLGINRFIIYDNKSSTTPIKKKNKTLLKVPSNLQRVLTNYISEGIVVLINWPYEYMLLKSGISGQTTQQNHSIYAFNKCKYIGLFDIDEYLNPQTKQINIDKIFDGIINKNNINIKNIGSFVIKCKLFFNPKNLPTDGYNFFKIYDADLITLEGREKNFVIPQNVKTFAVHTITSGKESFIIDYKILYFNHYFFLNKKQRGLHKTKYTDNTIKRILNLINIEN